MSDLDATVSIMDFRECDIQSLSLSDAPSYWLAPHNLHSLEACFKFLSGGDAEIDPNCNLCTIRSSNRPGVLLAFSTLTFLSALSAPADSLPDLIPATAAAACCTAVSSPTNSILWSVDSLSDALHQYRPSSSTVCRALAALARDATLAGLSRPDSRLGDALRRLAAAAAVAAGTADDEICCLLGLLGDHRAGAAAGLVTLALNHPGIDGDKLYAYLHIIRDCALTAALVDVRCACATASAIGAALPARLLADPAGKTGLAALSLIFGCIVVTSEVFGEKYNVTSHAAALVFEPESASASATVAAAAAATPGVATSIKTRVCSFAITLLGAIARGLVTTSVHTPLGTTDRCVCGAASSTCRGWVKCSTCQRHCHAACVTSACKGRCPLCAAAAEVGPDATQAAALVALLATHAPDLVNLFITQAGPAALPAGCVDSAGRALTVDTNFLSPPLRTSLLALALAAPSPLPLAPTIVNLTISTSLSAIAGSAEVPPAVAPALTVAIELEPSAALHPVFMDILLSEQTPAKAKITVLEQLARTTPTEAFRGAYGAPLRAIMKAGPEKVSVAAATVALNAFGQNSEVFWTAPAIAICEAAAAVSPPQLLQQHLLALTAAPSGPAAPLRPISLTTLVPEDLPATPAQRAAAFICALRARTYDNEDVTELVQRGVQRADAPLLTTALLNMLNAYAGQLTDSEDHMVRTEAFYGVSIVCAVLKAVHDAHGVAADIQTTLHSTIPVYYPVMAPAPSAPPALHSRYIAAVRAAAALATAAHPALRPQTPASASASPPPARPAAIGAYVGFATTLGRLLLTLLRTSAAPPVLDVAGHLLGRLYAVEADHGACNMWLDACAGADGFTDMPASESARLLRGLCAIWSGVAAQGGDTSTVAALVKAPLRTALGAPDAGPALRAIIGLARADPLAAISVPLVLTALTRAIETGASIGVTFLAELCGGTSDADAAARAAAAAAAAGAGRGIVTVTAADADVGAGADVAVGEVVGRIVTATLPHIIRSAISAPLADTRLSATRVLAWGIRRHAITQLDAMPTLVALSMSGETMPAHTLPPPQVTAADRESADIAITCLTKAVKDDTSSLHQALADGVTLAATHIKGRGAGAALTTRPEPLVALARLARAPEFVGRLQQPLEAALREGDWHTYALTLQLIAAYEGAADLHRRLDVLVGNLRAALLPRKARAGAARPADDTGDSSEEAPAAEPAGGVTDQLRVTRALKLMSDIVGARVLVDKARRSAVPDESVLRAQQRLDAEAVGSAVHRLVLNAKKTSK